MLHPCRVKQLQEGYKLMEMKALLRNYGLKDTSLLNDRQMILMTIKYILNQDTLSSLEDALKIANTCMLPTAEVYIWRIVNLMDKEEGDSVISLIKSLPPEEAVEIAERTLIWARLRLEDDLDDSEEEWKMKLCVKKVCIAILKFLLRIQKENPWKKEEYEADLTLFKALAALQEKFNICISAEEYQNQSLRSRLLEEHIEAYKETRRSSRAQDEGTKSEEDSMKKPLTYSRLCQLASLLQKLEQEMGSELVLQESEAGRVGEALKICRDSYELHQNERTGQLLFSGCQKLCHMLGSDTPMVVPEGLDLAAAVNEMACQTATICSPDLLLDAVELCKYTSFAHEISRKCQIEDYGAVSEETSSGAAADPYREWTFNDFFTEEGAVLDMPTVLPVAYEAATALVPVAERRMYPLDCTSLAHSPFQQGKDLFTPCMRPVLVLVDSLQESSQLELALGLITNSFGALYQHVMANSDISLGEQVGAESELHGQLACQDARSFLSTAMQHSASMVNSIATALLHKVFNSRQVDHRLALGYCTILPQEIVYEKLWEIISNASQNYSKILISFQKVFRMPSVRKGELLRTLVQHPKVDTTLILKYCNAFSLDPDAALQLCIETPLLQTAITSPTEVNTLWDSEAPRPHASVVARAKEIIPLLKSVSGLVTSLSAILLKLDPYDYETIESLLTIMEQVDEGTSSISVNRALMLIKHLKSFKRISPPGDLEHQYVSEQGIPLSPSAQTRLPFHLIFFRTAQCFWKIISAELSEESFPKVMLICKLMKISSDMLYMKAALHVFQEVLKPQMAKETREGHMSAISKDMAKTMRTLQSYLCSVAEPEWAAALAHKIAQEIPTGPIKVQGLKFCLSLAEEWAKKTAETDESHGRAQVLLKKLALQHQRSATEAVLAAHKLNSEEHQKLVGKPARLVVLLYRHSSIAERFQNPTGSGYPDVHAAAQEIAEINDLDLKKIRDMLLEKWLCPDAQAAGPFGTHKQSYANKRRALHCLLCLADTCTVESVFKKPMKEVEDFLKCLTFLAEFEPLNIPYTYESFQRTPKEGMIKGLWKNRNHEPGAVKLVAELSLEYGVYDPVLWNGVLQKLIAFKMVPNFSRAWSSVVLAPLLSASCPLSPSQLEACYASLETLVRCPVLSDVDLTGIAEQCLQLDLPALALGCLLQIPQLEQRTQQMRGVLSSYQPETILQQVEEHMSQGAVADFAPQTQAVSSSPNTLQIRRWILDCVIHEKCRGLGLATCFRLLKLQEMDPGRLQGLVENLKTENRIGDAAAVITEFLKQSGNPVPSNKSAAEIVKMYFSELRQTEGMSSFDQV
ncbi:hypothetical protein lerEdw1_003552 [Lerista edwardsae]|nr:hypothetical protein lerEdw1_003552 [Lerista edwardsae]